MELRLPGVAHEHHGLLDDAGRAALALAKGLLGGLGIFGGLRAPTSLGPRLERAYALVESDVRRYLGFDPWGVLTRWFRVQA